MSATTCGMSYVDGRLVSTSCAYHAGGGYDYIHCAESGGHDADDAPIQYAYRCGATVEILLPGTGWARAVVERCEGNMDHREVSVRLKKPGRPVRHTVQWAAVRGPAGAMWR
jgi:hypothetical protein